MPRISTPFLILFTNVQGIFFGVVVSFLIATNYSIDVQGKYYLITSIVSWFLLCDFGLSQALLYLKKNEDVGDGVGFYLIIYLFFSFLFLFINYYVNSSVINNESIFYFLFFILNTLLSLLLTFYRSKDNEHKFWLVRVSEYTLYNIVNIFFIYYGFGVLSLLIATIVSSLINLIFVCKFRIFHDIGISFNKWKIELLPVQLKTAVDYFSTFVGIKPLLPLVANLMSISLVGRIGLSITLINILVSFIITCYLSFLNKVKNYSDFKKRIFKLSALSVLFYAIFSMLILTFIYISELSIFNRLVDLKDLCLLFLNGGVVVTFNVISGFYRINGKDIMWKYIIIYNVLLCISVYISLLFGNDFFFGFYLAFMIVPFLLFDLYVKK
ncbi:hypothetical protein [Photobacterium leiognathi]|uniref:hypothetical protein n=1 Tax=Photobacterium leiognathi TaxID=553611 RepID=UPI0029815D52|nr:hypothetical protein [Photobacterium leiognathi]